MHDAVVGRDLDGPLHMALADFIAPRGIPGAAVTTFGLGRPTRVACAGVRRAGHPGAVTLDDHWHVGSLTKAMTATIVLRLAERGSLSLGQSVLDALEGTGWERVADARHFSTVTVRDLLAHRAGVRANPSYGVFARYVLGGEHPARTNDVAVRQSLRRALEPAGSFTYSNAGYGIAGLIASHRSGRTWEELVRDHVGPHLGPTLNFGRPEWRGEQPWGHWRRLGPARRYLPYRITKRGLDLDIMRAAGDISLGLDGIARHGLTHLRELAALDGAGRHDLLAPASAAAMFSAVGPPSDPFRGGSYGLGWHLERRAPDFGGGRLVWHNGSDLFSFTLLALMPDAGRGVALTMNALQRRWHHDLSLVWEPLAELAKLGDR